MKDEEEEEKEGAKEKMWRRINGEAEEEMERKEGKK